MRAWLVYARGKHGWLIHGLWLGLAWPLALLAASPASPAASSTMATVAVVSQPKDSAPQPAPAQPSVAIYYGAAPAWDQLQAFDIAVVDPDHVSGRWPQYPHTTVAAYVALGEVHASREYAARLPSAWLKGRNAAWGSRYIDQAQAGWAEFFLSEVIAPLWARGVRSFFVDTVDAYQAHASTPEERARQEAGVLALLAQWHERYPEARLILNRGFEILPRAVAQAPGQIMALAAESLYQGYDAAQQRYRPVAAKDSEWLLAQLKRVRDELQLPVIVIDYVPAAERGLARATAQQIAAAGFIPWVSTGDLETLGVGTVEAMPRKVLLVHQPLTDEYALRQHSVVRLASMPLNYLGYAAEYVSTDELPAQALTGRYAGVVVWLNNLDEDGELEKLLPWLSARLDEKLPISLVGPLQALLDTPLAERLGLSWAQATQPQAPVRMLQQHAMLGFEARPLPQSYLFYALAARHAEPLLTLAQGGQQQQAAALTPWGGYVIWPYANKTLANEADNRWVIDPFAFFAASLRLPAMPVPDVTTESGRRMLLVHMDGDGFISTSELPGHPLAGEVVRERVVRKYRVPMTISVIEAELSPQGLYPQLSRRLETVARDIFREPHVELASHSYSHPFSWHLVSLDELDAEGGEAAYNLPLAGYKFDLAREIDGSIRYIEERLAPPGKKVKLFLWTGDCVPGRDALERLQQLGVLNMNGGDTTATRSRNTHTQIEGLGINRQGLFQVFAPNQNENVYTNEWTGPYYGYERVIETYALTEKPRRLKPINIYFHSYITTKLAGMRSLDKVFDYALRQETTPVYGSEYAQKVLDFQGLNVARSATGWRLRGANTLHTLRLPASMGVPDLAASRGVAGWRDEGDMRYVHLAAQARDIELVLSTAASSPPTQSASPRLVSANARIDSFVAQRGRWQWQLGGHVPLELTLEQPATCRLLANGRELKPQRREGALFHYRLTDHAARPLEAICPG